MQVIGFLGSTSPEPYASLVVAFHKGLSETGYIEGQNVSTEYHWARGRYDRLSEMAADFATRNVNLIVASGGTAPTRAAKNATATIPIVFAVGSDPVRDGLVSTLARPGGNLTGVSFLTAELDLKRVELALELVPEARAIALLVNPNNTNPESMIKDAQAASLAKGVQLHILNAASESEIDDTLATLNQLHARALVVASDAFLFSRREQLVALASRYAVPTIFPLREAADAGGVISYGASIAAAYHELGIYAGKILKGTKPADLPVLQPTTFELVINLKTAQAIGLTVPPSLLARADEMIE